MADLEASWESSDCRADFTEGGRAMMGGVGGESLPPRKRLLAGLRQNGWLSSSPPVIFPGTEGFSQGISQEVVSADDDEDDDGDGDGDGEVVAVDVVGAEQQQGCTGCNGVECSSSSSSSNAGLRRIKRGAVYLRLCQSCSLLYNKSMFCPHCLVMYHDASLLEGDPALWLLCCRCGRSVHAKCEIKQTSARIDASSYECPDCVGIARRHKESEAALNGVSGSRSKVCSGSVGANCSTEIGVSASPTVSAECSSLSFKKPRMSRERPKLENTDHADPSKSEQGRQVQHGGALTDISKSKNFGPVRKAAQGVSVPVSSHDAAVAAKSAAAQAFKVAMAAKENAAAKASAALKAAAAAKVALEAAAHAARAVAQVQVELRRKAANSEPRLAESFPKLQIGVSPESKKEKLSGRSVEKEIEPAGHVGAPSLDDEELARQLHRVINSSPRISCSLRRKLSVKPETPFSGVSNSNTDAVKAWPQCSQTSPTEPLSQPKPQQTRPRSVTYKDSKRFDSRISRHEVKEIEEIVQTGDQQPDASEQLGPELPSNHSEPQASEEMIAVIKEKAVQRVLTTSAREDLLTTADEYAAELPFEAMVEADAEAPHPISDIHDRRPDFLQDILEAAVLADSAMSLDEGTNTNVPEDTNRSECDGGSQPPEGHSSFSHLFAEAKEDKLRSDAVVVDEVPSAARLPTHGGDGSVASQDVEMADANIVLEDFGSPEMMDADVADMVSKHSGAAEVVRADDAEVAVNDSEAAEVMCGDDADMVLKEYATEVVCADDADTALKDSRASETIHTNVSSGVTPGAGLEACSESVLGVQKDVVVEPELENNTGQKEVVASLEEETTVSNKDSRPVCKVIQGVVFGVSDCLGISEASSQLVIVRKDEDTMHMGLEETTANGQDSRPDCKETQEASSQLVIVRKDEDAMHMGLGEITANGQDSRLDCEGTQEASSQLVIVRKDEDAMHMGFEETTANGQDSRPDCQETQEASSQLVIVRKDEDAMQMGLEETTANGQDSRPDCQETQNQSLLGGAVSGFVSETCDLQATLVHSDAGSSEGLPQAAQAREETVITWPENKLNGLPPASQPLATGARMAAFSSAAQIPIQTPAFASGPGG